MLKQVVLQLFFFLLQLSFRSEVKKYHRFGNEENPYSTSFRCQ